jgi:hypothetical protein
VKYATRKKRLVPLRRGIYVIPPPYTNKAFDPFVAAQLLWGPSYISFESALSFHGWIPEAVYTTTSASAKRGRVIKTPKGVFRYLHVPETPFYLEVARVSNEVGSFLVAEPWKAIADLIYAYRKDWKTLDDLSEDLRVEPETLRESHKESLEFIALYYKSAHVKRVLSRLIEGLRE